MQRSPCTADPPPGYFVDEAGRTTAPRVRHYESRASASTSTAPQLSQDSLRVWLAESAATIPQGTTLWEEDLLCAFVPFAPSASMPGGGGSASDDLCAVFEQRVLSLWNVLHMKQAASDVVKRWTARALGLQLVVIRRALSAVQSTSPIALLATLPWWKFDKCFPTVEDARPVVASAAMLHKLLPPHAQAAFSIETLAMLAFAAERYAVQISPGLFGIYALASSCTFVHVESAANATMLPLNDSLRIACKLNKPLSANEIVRVFTTPLIASNNIVQGGVSPQGAASSKATLAAFLKRLQARDPRTISMLQQAAPHLNTPAKPKDEP